MDNVVIPRVEKTVKSFTYSSGCGPRSVVQSLDERNFSGNMEYTPLMTTSSLAYLNIEQDRNDESVMLKTLRTATFRH